ncbi:hypothetical protein CGMCC3_g3480 [Colletotrichum fructicola]|nr:uncharacterized protein CGMCC3_g3480 [Colletotrichum fructicola]KAE9580687.1 hypothetical protein CGMCC3_g3480 [Colletotrichum fructicola]
MAERWANADVAVAVSAISAGKLIRCNTNVGGSVPAGCCVDGGVSVSGSSATHAWASVKVCVVTVDWVGETIKGNRYR